MSRKVVPSILALAGVMVSVLAVPVPVNVACDANGDRAVDVRDLQVVISVVLEGVHGSQVADVNRDGCVDIRDFQRILQQAQASDAPMPMVPREHREQAVLLLSRGQEPCVPASIRQNVHITQGKRVATAALQARSVPLSVFSAKEERYYYRLTPNAPPEREQCPC